MENITTLNLRQMEDHAARALALNDAAKRLMQRVLGCWEHDLSRPFSHRGRTYRVCVKCGMAEDVDPETSPGHGNSMSAESFNTIYRATLQSVIANGRLGSSGPSQTAIGNETTVTQF